jgi:hypothetical protein
MTSSSPETEPSGALAGMDPRVPRSLEQIPAGIAIPADTICVFASGSLVAGWGHAASDVDLYVVTSNPAAVTPTATLDLGLSAVPLPVVTAFGPDELPYDVEYWTTAQVDDLLTAVLRADRPEHPLAARLTYQDIDWFFRLSIGVAIIGQEWLRQAQQRLAGSSLPLLLAGREFFEADGLVEDALGLLEVGDEQSAVLAARGALGYAVDGYLYARGSLSPAAKWRYRKLAGLPGSALPPDAYWRLETMRDLDLGDVAPWVEEVARICQSLILEVDFS